MHRQMGKVIDLSLAGCLFFLFIIGCSTRPRARNSLDALETPAKWSQEEVHKAEDKDEKSSSLLLTGESEIKEKMLPVPPTILKSSDEQPSGIETQLAGFSMEERREIGENTNKKEEAFPLIEETRIKRETPAINHVTWRKNPIGQRALELSDTEPDREILEILRKEYGKQQLDQWLGISKEQMRSEDTY